MPLTSTPLRHSNDTPIRVEEPEAIRPALDQALAMRAPVLVDVVTDALPRAPEPWNPPA